MVGAKGSRVMHLLKRTSEHHTPRCLAAAFALGILAGLAPKSSLMAIAFYVAMWVLPLHTLLSISVSAIISIAAGRLDWLTHSLGLALLESSVMRPLWLYLNASFLVSWVGLHNSVTLGSLVLGFVQLAPTYLVSLRLLERLTIANDSVRVDDINSQTQSATPRRRSQPQSVEQRSVHISAVATAVSANSGRRFEIAENPHRLDAVHEVEFDPVKEVLPIINAWHMSRPARPVREEATVRMDAGAKSRAETLPRRSDSIAVFAEKHVPEPIAVSLSVEEVAQQAADVLDWVDELLDVCLTDTTPSDGTCEYDRGEGNPPSSGSASSVHNDIEFEAIEQSQAIANELQLALDAPCAEDSWLMETTTEIVRWADEPMPQATTPEPSLNSKPMINANSIEASAASGPVSFAHGINNEAAPPRSSAGIIRMAPTGEVSSTQERLQSDRCQANGAQLSGSNQSESSLRGSSSDTNRGECLSYLLDHLRHTRDGRTS